MSLTRLAILFGALVYTSALQWVYPLILVPRFDYAGMTYRPQTLASLAGQFALAWLPSLWLPKDLHRPSQYQVWILYLTVIVPSCILPFHVTALRSGSIFGFIALLLSCFAAMWAITAMRPLRMPLLSLSPIGYAILLSGISLVTYGGLIYYRGLPALFLPIDQVYDLRTELRATSIPLLLNYLLWWQGTVVNPIITSVGFISRRPLLIILGTLLQIQLYSISSLRFFLAAAVFQIGIGIFMRLIRRRQGLWFLYAITGSVFVAVGWYFLDQHALGPLLLLDRWIFNAGQLSGYYLEFFSSHPPAGMTHSSIPPLQWLFPGPYDLPNGQVIGREYFPPLADGAYTNATAHFWADALASFGTAGVVVASLVAAFLLRFTDSACKGRNRQVAVMSFAIVGLSLTGQGVLTTLLTGGLAPFALLLALMPYLQEPHASRQRGTTRH